MIDIYLSMKVFCERCIYDLNYSTCSLSYEGKVLFVTKTLLAYKLRATNVFSVQLREVLASQRRARSKNPATQCADEKSKKSVEDKDMDLRVAQNFKHEKFIWD